MAHRWEMFAFNITCAIILIWVFVVIVWSVDFYSLARGLDGLTGTKMNKAASQTALLSSDESAACEAGKGLPSSAAPSLEDGYGGESRQGAAGLENLRPSRRKQQGTSAEVEKANLQGNETAAAESRVQPRLIRGAAAVLLKPVRASSSYRHRQLQLLLCLVHSLLSLAMASPWAMAILWGMRGLGLVLILLTEDAPATFDDLDRSGAGYGLLLCSDYLRRAIRAHLSGKEYTGPLLKTRGSYYRMADTLTVSYRCAWGR